VHMPQRRIGNPTALRALAHRGEAAGADHDQKASTEGMTRETTRCRGFDFSKISIHPPNQLSKPHLPSALAAPALPRSIVQPRPTVGAIDNPLERHVEARKQFATVAGAMATRNADGSGADEEEFTNNGTPAPAPGVFPPSPPPPPAPFAPSGQCYVETGPTYTPSGTIPVTNVGGRKSASFSMAATFGTAFVTDPPRKPACCEVRQYIKWNEAYHTWRGGPPHSGFPSSATYGTWYEDRDTSDKRYGHRSGTHSDPIAGCGDEYLTGGSRDQTNGDTYCGSDNPKSSAPAGATYNFQLKVIDTCNNNGEKASSSIITINW
jgi:hypothetical protein